MGTRGGDIFAFLGQRCTSCWAIHQLVKQKESSASHLFPVRHLTRKRATYVRSKLLALKTPVSPDDVVSLLNDATMMRDDFKKLESHKDLSLYDASRYIS